jgi:peptide/nickel transport system permease protein
MKSGHRYFSRWQNWIGFLLISLFVLVAIFAPLLSPNDPNKPGPLKTVGRFSNLTPQPPFPGAPLGTLSNQVSVFHALVWGTRSALVFGLTVTIISALIGGIIGSVSAYFGGFTNRLLMWVSNSFMTFPLIAAVVFLQQLITIALDSLGANFDFFGNMFFFNANGEVEIPSELPNIIEFLQNINPLLIAFILFSWMPYARLMNTVVLRIKQSDYVIAAKASGARNTRIILRHIIPNAIAPIIVLAAKDIGGFVVLQSTFAFIGFGKGSPWATVLIMGRDWIYSPQGILTYWWVFLPATLMLIFFGIGWNLVGDGLNDALNPRINH